MQPRVYKTEAIVLKGMDLGEADRLLTLFTPYLGKIRAVAKGARRPGSKLGGHTQVLTHSLMMLARGRSLDIITQSQTLHAFLPLRDDLWRLSCGLYVAELVEGFTPEGAEDQSLFQLLLEVLDWLSQARKGDLVLRSFELRFLEHLGYRPELGRCLGCGQALEPTTNFFSPHAGGVLCPRCSHQEPGTYPLSATALKVMRMLQQASPQQADRLKLGLELAQEIGRAMKGYLSFLLDREVKAGAWLDRLQNLRIRREVEAPGSS